MNTCCVCIHQEVVANTGTPAVELTDMTVVTNMAVVPCDLSSKWFSVFLHEVHSTGAEPPVAASEHIPSRGVGKWFGLFLGQVRQTAQKTYTIHPTRVLWGLVVLVLPRK